MTSLITVKTLNQTLERDERVSMKKKEKLNESERKRAREREGRKKISVTLNGRKKVKGQENQINSSQSGF